MSKILVKQNQIIKKGAKIGLVGSSGYATGPHVCYRFWVDGVQVDPFAVNIATVEKKHLSKTHIVPSVTEEENEKDFKNFVSGFFKQKTTED
jgi:murein DD-endopeptidase MepM/ murein hydrolase activator NlpD